MISSIRLLALAIILLSHSACKNPYGDEGSAALKFGANNSPNADSDNPPSVIVAVDQIDDDNSSTGFGAGTHIGTTYQNGVITLNAQTNYAELDESWTPRWENVVAYWKMDEASWNGAPDEVLDFSGNGHHGTRDGDATTSSGKVGTYAGVFDGTGDSVTISNPNDGAFDVGSTTDFSISLWVKFQNNGNARFVFSKYTSGASPGFGVTTGSTGDLLDVFIRDGTGSGANELVLVRSVEDFSDSNWHHLIATFDRDGLLSLYVDGDLQNSSSITTITDSVSNTLPIIIGARGVGDHLQGSVDDVAFFKNVVLSAEEVALIHSRQSAKYAGEMKSRIIDSKDTNSSWTNLDWIPTLPFGKELPDGGGVANSENSVAYPSLVSNTLMDGVVGLWHLNESSAGSAPGGSDFEDSSGVGNHATVTSGSISYGQSGKLKNSYNNNASGQVTFGSALIPTGNSPRTISVWYNTLNTSNRTILAYGSHNNSQLFELVNYNNNFIFHGYGGGFDTIAIPAPTKYGAWNHGLISYDGAVIKIYLNGEFRGQKSLALNTGSGYFRFGQGYFTFWDGSIDEVAIWNRTLSAVEAIELYRRGANRIKYQVRTCANSDCSDQDSLAGNGWQGPGGNYLTYFSELYNNSYVTSNCSVPQECFASELSLDGDVKTDSPSIYFNQFGPDGASMENNRYFQYRVIMESDDESASCDAGTSTCMPELKSVEVGPSHTYEEPL